MDETRALTNKIFKQKINEYLGADVVELPAANDDRLLDCEVFEAGMKALKDNKDSSEITYYAHLRYENDHFELDGVWDNPEYNGDQILFDKVFNDIYVDKKNVIMLAHGNFTGIELSMGAYDSVYDSNFILKPTFGCKEIPDTGTTNSPGGAVYFSAISGYYTLAGLKFMGISIYCICNTDGDTIWERSMRILPTS